MTTNEIPVVYFNRVKKDKYLQVTFQIQNVFHKLDEYCIVTTRLTDTVGNLLNNIIELITQKMKKLRSVSPVESASTESVTAEFYSNDEPVLNEYLCLDLPFWIGEDMELRINTVTYTVVLNVPCVDSMALPRIIVSGTAVSPNHLQLSYAEMDECLFSWYRKKGVEVTYLARGYCYTPVEEDIDCNLVLECIPRRGDLKGPKCTKTSKNCVIKFPEKFPFEERHKYTTAAAARGSFRIMSYNILSDFCVGSKKHQEEFFPYCVPYALDVHYRKLLLNKEILGYNADIICLQEVDASMFEDNLLHIFSNRYDGTFWQKSPRITEGLALFYDNSKFRLERKHEITLADELQVNLWLYELWNSLKSTVEKLPRFLKSATSLQVAILLSQEEEDQCLIVANTHLRSYPETNTFRALQTSIALRYLERVISEISETIPDKKISVVFCGDFNSKPDSCVYELLTKQVIRRDHPCWYEGRDAKVKAVNLSHTLKLESAYGKPKFTNYTHEFVGCLDFIFYQMDTLQVLQVVPLPSEEEVTENTAIPSPLFPSDHVALIADLGWI